MFGAKHRRQYNGTVDIKLNNEYQIATHDNPKFGGVLGYLEMLDLAWRANMSGDEAAMYIATLYYCGMLEHDHWEDCPDLLQRIQAIAQFGVPRGMISAARWAKFSSAIEEAHEKAGPFYVSPRRLG